MKSFKTFIAVPLAIAAALTAAALQAQQLANQSRESVTFSQYVDPGSEQRLADTAIARESRSFFRKVSGAELNRGIELVTDADRAVIQITPLDGVAKGARVTRREIPKGMTLSNGAQRRSVNDDSIALHRMSQGLRQIMPAFYRRAHAMRVPADMGHGKLTLHANGNAAANSRYVVYVLDKHSDTTLQVQAPKTRFSRDGRLQLDAHTGGRAHIDSISATLVAPGGERYVLGGQMRGNQYRVDWPIRVSDSGAPGQLWEIEVASRIRSASGALVERVATVATDIFQPTADLASVYSDTRGLRLDLDIRQPGRYEARALVQGRDRNGDYLPIVLSYSAEWLEAGRREMSVPVDMARLAASGLDGPYRVQSLQLLDQSRMAVLDYQRGSWELGAP